MGKGAWIAAVLGIVIAVGAGAYVVVNRQKPAPATTTNESMMMEGETSMNKSSLRGLLGLGLNQMCTFQDSETGDVGTVYIAGSAKMSGDFTTYSNDNSLTSHMILENDTMYVWQDGAQDGFMMENVSELQDTAETPQQSSDSAPDLDKPIDYECKVWVVDQAKFTPPANVNFQDFSAMMQQGEAMMEDAEGMMEDTSDQCAACNSLPVGDAQDQCLAALNCN